MNSKPEVNLKKSEKAKNLEKFFISNHRVSINRNRQILEDINKLDQDRKGSDKHLKSSINLKEAKVTYLKIHKIKSKIFIYRISIGKW